MKEKILEFFDFNMASNLLEDYNKSTGFVTAILDLEGNVLSKSGWRQICTDFHRKNPETSYNCNVSDTVLCKQNQKDDKCNFYKCLNGLIDVQAPIIIRGEHIANLFSGQLFFEEPDISFFEKQAKTYGFKQKEYIEALKKVPVISKKEVETNMKFLQNIVQLLIEVTVERVNQLELNEELKFSKIKLENNINDLLKSQEIAQLGTWRLDIETSQVVWSKELYEMYGFDPDLPPPPYTEHMKLFTPESWNKLSENLERTKEFGTPYELELKTVTKEGNNGWMWVRGEAKKDSNGKIVSIWGAAQDITERKIREEKIFEGREKFRATLLSVGDGVISTDNQGKVNVMNKVAEKLTGWTQEEAYNKPLENVLNIINEYSREICESPAKKALQLGKTVEMENHTILISKCGREIPIEDSASPIKDKDGNIKGAVIVFRDFTEKRKKQKEIEYLSFHDHLTGLYNRSYMEDSIKRLDTKRNIPFSIIVSDVNGLKLTNDAYGHEIGDKLLIKVAEILKKSCREDDIICRSGGDEIVILLPKTDLYRAEEIKNRIQQETDNNVVESAIISLAVGCATKNKEDKKILEVYKDADNQMYKEKIKNGKIMRSKTIENVLLNINNKYDNEQIHSQRVSQYCEKITKAMNLNKKEIENAKIAGTLHDIGKIVVSPKILNKIDKLKKKEWEEIKRHVTTSYQVLKNVDEYTHLAEAVLYHHEKLDGTGYPEGLKEDEIPLLSKIIAVADAYEAMTATRPYQKTKSKEEAVEELKKYSGTQFDKNIIDLFVNKVL